MTRVLNDFREMIREQVYYRELFFQMAYRDLLLRYKQTVMGFAWALFMPLVNTVVFSIIFMRVAPIDVGMPYPLFAFCGLLTWNFFASSMRFSVNSLSSNAGLVTKVFFPREILPVSAVLVCLVDFFVASLALVALMIWYSVGWHWSQLMIPVVVLVQLSFTIAISLLLSMANLFFRDVKYLFDVLLTVWLFMTAALYPVDRITGLSGTVMKANPMTHIIEGYRDVLLRGAVPDGGFWIVAAASLVTLVTAWLVFHRAEFSFAENI